MIDIKHNTIVDEKLNNESLDDDETLGNYKLIAVKIFGL